MIERHRARDVFRKHRPLPEDLGGAAPSAPISSPDDSLDRQLHSALASLPELHRSALTLRYFEELDYASIEKLLGISNGTLRGILGRALASLRKQLRPALASLE
jgi:RNA polymerase sigma factor (sigma-70 family)